MPPDHESTEGARVTRLRTRGPAISVTLGVMPRLSAMGQTRAFVRRTLAGWDVDDAAANAALDVANELVSNAIQWAEPPLLLRLAQDTDVISVLVEDATAEPARMVPYRSGVTARGLGLRLVARLSYEWGQDMTSRGKVVWATVGRRSRAGHDHPDTEHLASHAAPPTTA